MICPICGYSMDALDADCPKCHGQAPSSNATPLSQPVSTRPGTVQFTHQSPEEIRAEAERRIRSGFHARGNAGTGQALKASALCLGLSYLCRFIPAPYLAAGGALLAAGLAACALLCLVGAGGAFLSSRLRKASETDLAATTYILRNMAKGQCPLCKAAISLAPIELVTTVKCPACHGALYFSHGVVQPA